MADRKFLIVVDMQNDFIDGSLGTPEAQAMVEAAEKRIHECRQAGYRIIATLDTHTPDYMETSEGKHLPVLHCIRGTHGWEIRTVHGYLCGVQRTPAQGKLSRGGLLRACGLLRGRHTGKTSRGPGNHAELPD